jgi:signal transduction histidine kinase
MATSAGISRPTADKVRELVMTALGQTKLAGMSSVLQFIAESFDADGCILWEETPGSRLKADPPVGEFFAEAQWFHQTRFWTTYRLELACVTGQAVLAGKTAFVEDAANDPRVDFSLPFFRRTGIRSFCAIPIPCPDGRLGALDLYRLLPGGFTPDELHLARRMADLVPGLLQAIRDRVSFGILRELDLYLEVAEQGIAAGTGEAAAGEALQLACALVGDAFPSLETSLVLEDRLRTPGRYDVVATTFPQLVSKRSYVASDQGLTSWVLQNQHPVDVFDLACFEQDRPILERRYPGITWLDRDQVLDIMAERFKLPIEELPPVSFICVPVTVGERLLGALRCCAALLAPHYYAERDVELLKLLATRIGQFWDSAQRQRESAEEIASLRSITEGVSRLNQLAQTEFRQPQPNERGIDVEAVRVLRGALRAADIAAVVNLSAAGGPVETTLPLGERLAPGDLAAVLQAAETVTAGDQPQARAAAVAAPPGCERIRYMIAAPVGADGAAHGVLVAASTGEREFTPHALAVTGLVAEQISLYHDLARTLDGRREAERERREAALRQVRTYQNLAHQLRSPVLAALRKVSEELKTNLPPLVRDQLASIRGSLSWASTMVWSTQMFAQLTEHGEVRANLRPVAHMDLLAMVQTAARDEQERLDPDRGIEIMVSLAGFAQLEQRTVWMDVELIEHAVSNLLSNAGKYSSPRTTVEVYAGVTKTDRFHITFRNKGLRILPQDVANCVERGWRGEAAKLVTGSGSGVGLWLVFHVMKAHNGELLVLPTTPDGWTEVKLLFRLETKDD